MRLGPVTKLNKTKKKEKEKRPKEIEDDVMPENCDVSTIFLIYSQFGAIRKPDFGRMVCKTYVSINSNLLSYKN